MSTRFAYFYSTNLVLIIMQLAQRGDCMIKFNIKVQRLLHNKMSQKQLSELTGIRLPTLSEYENGTAKTIRVEHINKLCEVFNCQVSDLITFCPYDDKCAYCFNR